MRDMKISSMSGKYITADNEAKNIKLKSKAKTNDQLLSYSAQGQLVIGDKCVTYPTGSGNPLFLTDCVGDDKQNWNLVGNSIRPDVDGEQCMSSKSDIITTSNCDNSDSQSWQTEHSDDSEDSFKWTNYFGKTVVLVESDDPWYLNKDTTIPMQYLKDQTLFDEASYRHNADFKSSKVLDLTLPDVGMGYSYSDRQGQPCQKIEGFNGGQQDSSNILILLLCIFILILIYRYCMKNKYTF